MYSWILTPRDPVGLERTFRLMFVASPSGDVEHERPASAVEDEDHGGRTGGSTLGALHVPRVQLRKGKKRVNLWFIHIIQNVPQSSAYPRSMNKLTLNEPVAIPLYTLGRV